MGPTIGPAVRPVINILVGAVLALDETRLRSKVFSLEKTLVLTLLWILICGEGEVKSTHSPWPGF